MPVHTKVRWAILGAGKIAHEFVHDFKAVQNAELVAVAARDKNRAADFVKPYGIAQALTYDELYNSPDVDAVYIATTHNFHFEQTQACLQHGKAVLCEKPITINDVEFKKLAALAAEKKLFLMEAMWTYFLPPMKKAADWIASGKLGAIKAFQAGFGVDIPFDPEARLYNPKLAGGALLDLGIYPIALATFFMNRKPDVAKATAIMTSTQVDESTDMIFKYDTTAAFLYTTLANNLVNKAVILGEKGYIEIPDFYKAGRAELYDYEKKLIDSLTDDRQTAGYNYEIQEATDCILAGQLQSAVVPHARSNELQEIMTDIRRQIQLRYPMEESGK